jgi:hypothetical protein
MKRFLKNTPPSCGHLLFKIKGGTEIRTKQLKDF